MGAKCSPESALYGWMVGVGKLGISFSNRPRLSVTACQMDTVSMSAKCRGLSLSAVLPSVASSTPCREKVCRPSPCHVVCPLPSVVQMRGTRSHRSSVLSDEEGKTPNNTNDAFLTMSETLGAIYLRIYIYVKRIDCVIPRCLSILLPKAQDRLTIVFRSRISFHIDATCKRNLAIISREYAASEDSRIRERDSIAVCVAGL